MTMMMTDTTASMMNWKFKTDKKPSAGAKKCLFGEPDHVATRAELVKQLDKIRQDDSRKWNYNFKTDEPLEGRYGWERVVKLSHPNCSAHSNEDSFADDFRRGIDRSSDDSDSSSVNTSPEATPITSPKSFKKPNVGASSTNNDTNDNVSHSGITAQQKTIPEFFQKRKRSLSPLDGSKRVKRTRKSSLPGECTPVARSLANIFIPISK